MKRNQKVEKVDKFAILMDKTDAKQLARFLESAEIKEAYRIVRAVCGSMRFKIAVLLSKHRTGLTVTELAQILNSSLSRISHQLRILRKYRLVNARGQNREVVYTLANHRIRKHLPF